MPVNASSAAKSWVTSVPSIEGDRVRAALGARDPETLVGPLLWLMTRLARGRGVDPGADEMIGMVVSHLTALAAHPGVAAELRLAAGGLAIEHRPGGRMR